VLAAYLLGKTEAGFIRESTKLVDKLANAQRAKNLPGGMVVACRGLMESAAKYLPEAQWQRCMVHFYRNVFNHVPATKVEPHAQSHSCAGEP
jgi:transposase-like protein